MYKKKDFIGMEVRQGSPGYTVPEVIKNIVWDWNDMTKVVFESGCYTLMTDEEFEVFAAAGEVDYKRPFRDGFALETMYKRWQKT